MTIDDGPTALTVAFALPNPAVYDSLWCRLYAAGTDASAAIWMQLSAAQAAAGTFAVTPGTSGVYK